MSDSIIHRWSKRKQLDREAAQEKPDQSELQQKVPTESETAESDPVEQEKVELPDIDSLDDDSDYSAFLSPEVDEALRKVALRKLFRAPFFNQLDGLNDYDEDFTTFEALGDIVTSDMKFHEERKKAEAAAKAEAEAEEAPLPEEQPPTLAEDTPEEQDSQDDASTEQDEESSELAAADQSEEDDQTAAG